MVNRRVNSEQKQMCKSGVGDSRRGECRRHEGQRPRAGRYADPLADKVVGQSHSGSVGDAGAFRRQIFECNEKRCQRSGAEIEATPIHHNKIKY